MNGTLNSAAWQPLIQPIVGIGGVMSLTDAGGGSVTSRFYRVVVLP